MSVSRGREDSAALAGVVNGYAPLDSGLLVPRAYLPQISGLLHNMSASSAPTVNDDTGDGYGIGSRWLNTTTDIEYVCLDSTAAAAVWIVTGSKVTTYTPVWSSSNANAAIGNGTISGSWCVLATGLVQVYIQMTLGSGSTIGTGSYLWSLPSGLGTFTNLEVGGVAHYRDNSSTLRAAGVVVMNGATDIQVYPALAGTSVTWSATTPVNPPAQSDSYNMMFLLRAT